MDLHEKSTVTLPAVSPPDAAGQALPDRTGAPGEPAHETPGDASRGAPEEPAHEAPEEPPRAPDAPFTEVDGLDRFSKILLAVVPALTVALTAIGSATGGLARMFRDQTDAARLSIGLVFLSFTLAALARRPLPAPDGSARRAARLQRVRVGMLLFSGVVLVIGVGSAFDAQITVMGRGQAPAVTGAVTPSASGDTLDAHVVATGVKSSDRMVVFAFESSDDHGDAHSTKVPLYYSKTGPDADGRVDVHVVADVPASDLQTFPYVFVTAVLGENQRDCDGVLVEGTGPPAPDETACLTLQRPGAPAPSTAGTSTTSAPPGALSAPIAVAVGARVAWTDTGVSLKARERFVVHATGQVTAAPGAAPVGPDGSTDPEQGGNVLPGADHHAALIGRIGGSTGRPFLVGSSLDGPADRAGELQLGINDTGLAKNSGGFQASVQVVRQ